VPRRERRGNRDTSRQRRRLASLIVIAAKTDATAGAKGISLFAVETHQVEGFSRGRLLKKLGQEGRDTTELFFTDMRITLFGRCRLDPAHHDRGSAHPDTCVAT
jgi:hypothetical protein